MSTSYIDLYVDQGTDFNYTINLTDDITSNVINLSGYQITSQMRRSYYTANAVNLTCTITDASNGTFQISLGRANTANLIDGKWVFAVNTIDTANTKIRILEGKIIVTPSAIRG